MLTTNHKGAIAETCIAAAAVKLGITVSKPLTDGQRYDLVFDFGQALERVQCKWATREGQVIKIWLRSSRHTPHGYVFNLYDETQIDAVAGYCLETDQCYYLPSSRGPW